MPIGIFTKFLAIFLILSNQIIILLNASVEFSCGVFYFLFNCLSPQLSCDCLGEHSLKT